MTGLVAGPHELRVQATDRFGLVETTPAVLRFTVDTRLPKTIAAVRLAKDGDRRASWRWAPINRAASSARSAICCSGAGAFEDIFLTPCEAATQPSAATCCRCARSTRPATGTRRRCASIPPLGQGFQGPESGLPTFAGARGDRHLGQPPSERTPHECRIDEGAWTACAYAFRLPILHPGGHTLQARQRLATRARL